MSKLGLEKEGELEIKLPTFAGLQRKQGNFRKNIYLCFIDYTKAFDYEGHDKPWKALRETGKPDHLTCSWETCMQVKEQQLEPCTEQLTGSGLRNE